MKRPVSIAFIFLYSLLLIRPLIPIVNYYIQFEAYKARCINIQRPLLECEGTCHLQSEIKQLATESEPIAPLAKSGAEDVPVCIAPTRIFLRNSVRIIKHLFVSPLEIVCCGFSGAIFHPPA